MTDTKIDGVNIDTNCIQVLCTCTESTKRLFRSVCDKAEKISNHNEQ